jgi:hypothetical protein
MSYPPWAGIAKKGLGSIPKIEAISFKGLIAGLLVCRLQCLLLSQQDEPKRSEDHKSQHGDLLKWLP